MTLENTDISARYKDVVQLEKSGLGLPSHAGKEAAVYDGSGAQILGRTAVRHWLDPHPDAASFAETWEFSATGDMTQAALETAGWTFSDCTAEVSGGCLVLTATGVAAQAYLSVSLAGDFDFVVGSTFGFNYSTASILNGCGGVMVTNTSTSEYYAASWVSADGQGRIYKKISGATTNSTVYGSPCVTRVNRVSGTIYVAGGPLWATNIANDEAGTPDFNNSGWCDTASGADATTFNKLSLIMDVGATEANKIVCVQFLRRFQ